MPETQQFSLPCFLQKSQKSRNDLNIKCHKKLAATTMRKPWRRKDKECVQADSDQRQPPCFERPAMRCPCSHRPTSQRHMDPVCPGGRGAGREPPEASAGLTFEYLYDTFALRRQQLVSLLITISLERVFQLLQSGAAPPQTSPLACCVHSSTRSLSPQQQGWEPSQRKEGDGVRRSRFKPGMQTHSAFAVLTEIRVSYRIPLHLLFHMRME